MRRIVLFLVCAVGLLSFSAQAAGPVMHIALGQQWLNLYAPTYTQEEKKLFLLGTVFPDIRYLGVIKRSQSHYKGMTLEKVYQANTPFMRGMYFHSFVDEYREKYIKQHDIMKKIATVPPQHLGTFLKLIEDEIIHKQNDWSEFRLYLASIPEEEKILDIKIEALREWHTALTIYFTMYPSFILNQFTLFDSIFDKGIFSFDPQIIKSWSALLPQYAADPAMHQYLDDLMKSFERTMEDSLKLTKQ